MTNTKNAIIARARSYRLARLLALKGEESITVSMQRADLLFDACSAQIAAANLPAGWKDSAAQRKKVADCLCRFADRLELGQETL